ncbi:unnamed protein product [Camellia sinensis]
MVDHFQNMHELYMECTYLVVGALQPHNLVKMMRDLRNEKHKNEDIQGSLFEEPSHGALFCTWETFKRTLKDKIDSKNFHHQLKIGDHLSESGQKRFGTLISSYYRGAHGIILIMELGNFPWLSIWLPGVPSKVGFFIWTVALGIVLGSAKVGYGGALKLERGSGWEQSAESLGFSPVMFNVVGFVGAESLNFC